MSIIKPSQIKLNQIEFGKEISEIVSIFKQLNNQLDLNKMKTKIVEPPFKGNNLAEVLDWYAKNEGKTVVNGISVRDVHKQCCKTDPSIKECKCQSKPTTETDFKEYFKNNPTKVKSTKTENCGFVKSKEEFLTELNFYEKQYEDKVNELRRQLEELNRAYCYTTNLLPQDSLYFISKDKEMFFNLEEFDNVYDTAFEKGFNEGIQKSTQALNNTIDYLNSGK